MKINFNGKWEAERIARIVEMWNPANEDLLPWRDDVVSRMRRQIDYLDRTAKNPKKSWNSAMYRRCT